MKTVNAGNITRVGQRAGRDVGVIAPQRPLIVQLTIRQRHRQGFVALNVSAVVQVLRVQRQAVRLPFTVIFGSARVQYR